MHEEIAVAVLIITLIICVLLSGLIGFIISIIALKKVNRLSNVMIEFLHPEQQPRIIQQPISITEPSPQPQVVHETPPPIPTPIFEPIKESAIEQDFKIYAETQKYSAKTQSASLEQKIGTKWVLILGVITLIFGTVFFLKYAYDNNMVGPLGRVIIVAFWGLVALAAGEITRKRGFGIVAKAVTALGFAMLYAADFSAYGFYKLIDSPPAFVIAIIITLAAMLYAVALDEIWMAILSLLGGYLTPVLVSTGENLPVPLFTYVLILSLGAMLCAYYRKWRAVNVIAFLGTFILYAGWFEKFFRSQIYSENQPPRQLAIALGSLAVFFSIYLILPLFNGLVKKIKAQKEDVLLVLSNSTITFYFCWTILYSNYRTELAFCAVGLCIAHLILLNIVNRRCPDDINLRLVLLAAGLFFLTIAIPLYFKMYAVVLAWAAEAVVLAIIGLRYRSFWTQISAAVAFFLSWAFLLDKLPLHRAAFDLVFNPAFGTWLFLAASAALCHILYRANKWIAPEVKSIISQSLYTIANLILLVAIAMELYWHCEYNLTNQKFSQTIFINSLILLCSIFTLLFVARPICPTGLICRYCAVFIAVIGSFILLIGFTEVYYSKFIIFANINFAIAVIFVIGLFLSAFLLNKSAAKDETIKPFAYILSMGAIFVLFVLLSEEIYLYWHAKNKYSQIQIPNWRFLANMYMSIMWAFYAAVLMIIGFWRNKAFLRYIALALFGVLLVKVFIIDMGTVKSVYRIAAFLATGITLVGVSYLYQFLKKKGFFEIVLNDNLSERRL
ncbi:MAG: hypothetical protein A2Y10_02120 [Planctomycetes bacterium GWF2_41_51]|nr:MAG: hypothetical protein A2Y10_02120 [Planctomycetes bacterium GWF2_41_51]HBG25796.1 hypothetical protein [Phycisphaerales bacterium]